MSKLFLGGNTTDPELNAIINAFQVGPGSRIAFDELAKVAGLDVRSTRFRTVTNRWRKRIERDLSIRVVVDDGHFVLLTPDQAHDHSRKDVYRIGKATGKMVARAAMVDPAQLSGERKERHQLLQREAGAMLDAVRKSAKAIAGPRPVAATNLRLAK